ncbi:MAG: 50S ribosomal protein L32, partial [Flavobacteriales bacterium]|nr:50S ribosomal protein L32 [Flavobacteriales bacterium]
SKTRRDKRRTHYKASETTLYTCPNCSAPVQYHRVCEECGTYRGKQAIKKQVSL